MTGDTDGAEEAAEPPRCAPSRRCAPPTPWPRPRRTAPRCWRWAGTRRRGRGAEAHALAHRAGRFDLVALCLNYESLAEADVDVDGRIDLLRASIALAARHGADEAVARGYTNLAEMLYRYARFAELEECARRRAGVHRRARLLRRTPTTSRCTAACWRCGAGDWADAEAGLEALVDQDDDPGMLAGHSRPPYGRLLARRGVAGAGQLLCARLGAGAAPALAALPGLRGNGAGRVRLAGRPPRPGRGRPRRLGPARRAAVRGTGARRAAALRRPRGAAGRALPRLPASRGRRGCAATGGPRPAAGQRIGDPYERALELAASGEPEPTLEALRTLEDLGAHAAVRHVRQRLRELGVTRIPRRPTAGTRAHPAGLTRRQADVLALLADGLTNAEIADRLVVSVRTVDTHVAAILDRLGVRTRREAAVPVAAATGPRTPEDDHGDDATSAAPTRAAHARVAALRGLDAPPESFRRLADRAPEQVARELAGVRDRRSAHQARFAGAPVDVGGRAHGLRAVDGSARSCSGRTVSIFPRRTPSCSSATRSAHSASHPSR